MESRKVKGGLKHKGLRNAPYEKMEKSSNESDAHAPCDAAAGKESAKKISHGHKTVKDSM
jgi:hypothetical protein